MSEPTIPKLLIDERTARAAGPFAYFSRYVAGAEHPIISRITRDDFDAGRWSAVAGAAPPPSLESLLDANELAVGHEFFKLGGAEHSPDHTLLAYATDVKGSLSPLAPPGPLVYPFSLAPTDAAPLLLPSSTSRRPPSRRHAPLGAGQSTSPSRSRRCGRGGCCRTCW
jgi:hypothetical protein